MTPTNTEALSVVLGEPLTVDVESVGGLRTALVVAPPLHRADVVVTSHDEADRHQARARLFQAAPAAVRVALGVVAAMEDCGLQPGSKHLAFIVIDRELVEWARQVKATVEGSR